MKIEIELYGASKDFSSENIIKLDLKNNSRIKDLRNELIKFIDKNHNGNNNFLPDYKIFSFLFRR